MTPIVADKASTKVVSYLVAYMTKSFTLFSAFFENCVLVTCTATEVHKFITKWQAYFKNSVPRRKRFADFIAGKGLSTAKCPKPCTTRWTPWLRAVLWHEERNRFVSEFLDSEHDQSDSVKSRELQDLVANGREIVDFRREMTAKFTFLTCRGTAKFGTIYRDKQMPLHFFHHVVISPIILSYLPSSCHISHHLVMSPMFSCLSSCCCIFNHAAISPSSCHISHHVITSPIM